MDDDQVELYDLQWGLPKGRPILRHSRPPLPDYHYHSLPAYIKEIVEEDSSEDENDENDDGDGDGDVKKDGHDGKADEKADKGDAYGLLDETLGLLFSDEVGQADQKDPDGGKPIGTVDLLNDTAGLIGELYDSEDEQFNNQARLTTANQLWQSPIPRARIPPYRLFASPESPFSATDVSPIPATPEPKKKKRAKLPEYARTPGVLVI